MGGIIENDSFIFTDGILNYLEGINPRNRKEKFISNYKGELFNSKGEKIGKIKYIKSRSVIVLKTTFIQEIKIVKQKRLKK